MNELKLDFVLNINKFYYILSKTIEMKLGGLGFNDFVILYTLNQAENKTLKRIELADKIGLTASGITRLLLPMEKIGLVKKEVNKNDARVSLVTIDNGGKQKLEEALDRLDIFFEENYIDFGDDDLKKFSDFLKSTGGKLLWK